MKGSHVSFITVCPADSAGIISDRNWLSFLSYLDSTFGLIASSSPGDDLTVRGLLTETWTFLNELAAKDGRKERGAHLARLEFSKRMRERHRTSPSLEESGIYAVLLEQDGLLSMMKGYIANFSEKACCFEDLKPYVNTLSVVSGEDELKMWLQYLAEQESNVRAPPTDHRTMISFLQTGRNSSSPSTDTNCVQTPSLFSTIFW